MLGSTTASPATAGLGAIFPDNARIATTVTTGRARLLTTVVSAIASHATLHLVDITRVNARIVMIPAVGETQISTITVLPIANHAIHDLADIFLGSVLRVTTQQIGLMLISVTMG
jgi:hypothetical protein